MNRSHASKRITLVDVARRAQVSRATASLVLRDSPLVADETRARVLAAMEDLGYVYNRAAASLRTQNSFTVGIIVTDLTNPFFAQMTVGIQSRFEEEGYALFLSNTGDTVSRQDKLIEAMYARGVDGLMLCPARGSDKTLLKRLRQWRLPTVFVARYIHSQDEGQPFDFDYVGADNEAGAHQAVSYLVEQGHRCIAFLGGPEDSSARYERLSGYRQALLDHNLECELNAVISTPVTSEGGRTAMDVLLTRGVKPTAILCYNDVIAFGAMMRMQALGIRPGIDIALIGFDNITESSFWQPALSSVAVKPAELGEQVAASLLLRMRDPDRPASQVILPSQLIIRESSGYKGHP